MTTTATTATAPAPNVTTVESIGRRTLSLAKSVDTVAAAIVASLPADHEWAKRGAVPAAIHAWAVPAGTEVPAQKKADKTPTAYGVGVDTLAHAIRRIVATEKETAPAMRVSLTGVGSAVVPTDHPAYALLLALLGADETDETDAA